MCPSVTCWTIHLCGISWNASQVHFATPFLCPKCPLGLPPSDEPRSKPQLPLKAGGSQTWTPSPPTPHTRHRHRDHRREEAGAELRGTAAWAWKKPLRALSGCQAPTSPSFQRGELPASSLKSGQTSRKRQLFNLDAIDTVSTSGRACSESGSADEFCPSADALRARCGPECAAWGRRRLPDPSGPTRLPRTQLCRFVAVCPQTSYFTSRCLSPFASTVVTV